MAIIVQPTVAIIFIATFSRTRFGEEGNKTDKQLNQKPMRFNTEIIIKIGLSVLLLLCLLHMPYSYYQFVRFIAVVGFAVLAYYEYERKNIPFVIMLVSLALLFQPLAKVPLGRQAWNIVDVVVAIGLILSIFAVRRMRD